MPEAREKLLFVMFMSLILLENQKFLEYLQKPVIL